MVDPNNEKLLDVESKGQTALDESNAAYDSAITNNTTTQTELLNKIDANTAEQKAAQQQQSDLAIQKIEQNKEWAKQDYQKEQRGAYVDWQKQSDPYGVNAEQMAASGLANTGYAESSQVAMYTAYQNRIATAREAYTRAVVSYDTAIAEAKATNSVALAEIASKALEASLNIAVQFAMQNNSLLVQKANQAATIRQNTFSNYMSVYNQLQDEAQHNESMAEQKRQFNASLAEEQRQFNIEAGLTSGDDGSAIINKANGIAVSPNQDSLLGLGLGAISAKKLDELVRSGKVIEVERNGQLYYSYAPGVTKNNVWSSNAPGYTAPGLNTTSNNGTSGNEATTKKTRDQLEPGDADPINGKTVEKKQGKYIYYTDGTKARYK